MSIITKSQMKENLKKIMGWNNRQYLNEYKKFVNRLRNYERLSGAVEKADATKRFYYITKDVAEGNALSQRSRDILNTTSASTTAKFSPKKYDLTAKNIIDTRFKNFISLDDTQTGRRGYNVARNIYNDPNLTWSEKLKKLEDYANKLATAKAIKEDDNGNLTTADVFENSEQYEPTIEGFEEYQ